MNDDYEILEPEQDKEIEEQADLIDMATEMAVSIYESFNEKLKRYGLSEFTEISDEDGDKLASAMIHGGQELEDCLLYLAGKYGSERIAEGVTNARLEQPRI